MGTIIGPSTPNPRRSSRISAGSKQEVQIHGSKGLIGIYVRKMPTRSYLATGRTGHLGRLRHTRLGPSACYPAGRTALMPTVNVPLRIALVLLLGAVLQKPAIALAAPQTQATGRMLLATVVDLSGKTQVDFGVDDFVIKEGGDEREVLDVHIAD